MKNLIYSLALMTALNYYLIAQGNKDYFPHHKNDYWEYYWDETFNPDTIVSFILFDSIDNDGNYITVFDSYFINPIAPPRFVTRFG